MSKPLVKYTEITPSEAAKFLASQVHNRRLSKQRVTQLAEDMLHRRWVFNGETIKLDENGRLLDGQHRLAAAVKANFTLPTLLVTGLADRSMESIDQGAKRSPAHVLQLLHVKSPVLVAAICRLMWQLEKFGRPIEKLDSSPTRAQIIAMFRKHRGLEDTAGVAWKLCSKKKMGMLAPSHVGVLYRMTMQLDADKAAAFWNELHEGGGDQGSVTRLLMLRLHGPRPKRRYAALAMAIKAWNAYVGRRKVGVLKYATGEEWPELEGGK